MGMQHSKAKNSVTTTNTTNASGVEYLEQTYRILQEKCT